MSEMTATTGRRGLPFRDPSVPLDPEKLELRKRVLKQIEYDPRSFSMTAWEAAWETLGGSCMTTRCICGWAEFLTDGSVPVPPPDGAFADSPEALDAYAGARQRRGVELLGLTRDEYSRDDEQLFYTDNMTALYWLCDLAENPEGGSGDAR